MYVIHTCVVDSIRAVVDQKPSEIEQKQIEAFYVRSKCCAVSSKKVKCALIIALREKQMSAVLVLKIILYRLVQNAKTP